MSVDTLPILIGADGVYRMHVEISDGHWLMLSARSRQAVIDALSHFWAHGLVSVAAP